MRFHWLTACGRTRQIRATSLGPPRFLMTTASVLDSLTAHIVSRVTNVAQGGLQTGPYGLSMSTEAPDTPAARVRSAIERSGKTLQELAQIVGCTHSALSQWQTGDTDLTRVKAGLLQNFCDATGTDVRWLLTGKGPVISRYALTAEMQRIGVALVAMEKLSPQQVETVVRMVEAAAPVARLSS